ncbi:hypothetical protein AMTR_s00007p00115390 [Amborella trichopoda]|uniref:Uncharacterized protein n=1 Tax=Amborella trichopoda TaxID=13333 RepID=W1PBE7_AMBTC|nr:hypothetical protein AMTR_s00007p00115390 [Amborella trichopoda]
MSTEDTKLGSAAASSVNRFANDGSFLAQFNQCISKDIDGCARPSHRVDKANETSEPRIVSSKHDGASGESLVSNQGLSANQWAAVKKSTTMRATLNPEHKAIMQGNSTRHSSGEFYAQKKRKEDADMHLAKRIVQNKQYTTYEEADDEYDFDKAPRKKQNEKGKSALEQKLTENTSFQPQLVTQQE